MTTLLGGKIALVFGAGTAGEGWGIGKACAVAYARAGAHVYCVDIDAASARVTADLIIAEGGTAEAATADVANEANVAAVLARVGAAHGHLDILHNNVGVPAAGGPEVVSVERWERVFDVNVKGTFLTCRHALPLLAVAGGSIVNVGSIVAHRYMGMPQLAYATSKGSLLTMTRAIAAEYAARNIRANLISPGIIETPLLQGATSAFQKMFGFASEAEALAVRKRTVPMGRFGSPWDVAGAATFLASDAAAYITGTELLIDGGLSTQIQFPML